MVPQVIMLIRQVLYCKYRISNIVIWLRFHILRDVCKESQRHLFSSSFSPSRFQPIEWIPWGTSHQVGIALKVSLEDLQYMPETAFHFNSCSFSSSVLFSGGFSDTPPPARKPGYDGDTSLPAAGSMSSSRSVDSPGQGPQGLLHSGPEAPGDLDLIGDDLDTLLDSFSNELEATEVSIR